MEKLSNIELSGKYKSRIKEAIKEQDLYKLSRLYRIFEVRPHEIDPKSEKGWNDMHYACSTNKD